MSKFFRSYEIVRDEKGMPCKLEWTGDYEIPEPPNKAERDAKKLQEWEKIYGKSEPEVNDGGQGPKPERTDLISGQNVQKREIR